VEKASEETVWTVAEDEGVRFPRNVAIRLPIEAASCVRRMKSSAKKIRRPQKQPSYSKITVSTVCHPLGVLAPVCDLSAPFCPTPRAASNALQLAPLLPTCRPHMEQWTSNVLGHSSGGGPCALKPTSLLTFIVPLGLTAGYDNRYANTALGLYPCKLRDAGGTKVEICWAPKF